MGLYPPGYFDERLPDPPPKTFEPVSGSRMAQYQTAAKLDEICDAEEHQRQMADVAVRAVRYFGGQPWEVDWKTLKFEVVGFGRPDEEGLQIWRWTVWVS